MPRQPLANWESHTTAGTERRNAPQWTVGEWVRRTEIAKLEEQLAKLKATGDEPDDSHTLAPSEAPRFQPWEPWHQVQATSRASGSLQEEGNSTADPANTHPAQSTISSGDGWHHEAGQASGWWCRPTETEWRSKGHASNSWPPVTVTQKRRKRTTG